MIDLILATRNAHKVEEIQTILGKDFRVRSLAKIADAPDLIEDADTFAGNATRKARQLAQWLGKSDAFVLADDSGLEVDALNGAPGVHSARFAQVEPLPLAAVAGASGTRPTRNSPDATNIEKLLRLLRDVPAEKRTARFRCVLALVNGQTLEAFDGVCEGVIAMQPTGSGGFGYDPVFLPNGYSQSFSELGEDIKNRISHRARALQKLQDYFSSASQAHRAPTPPRA